MTDLNKFYSQYKGGARPNRYRVQISYPAIVGAPDVEDEIMVKAAGMPASVLGQILVPYQGRQIPVPGDRTFEEWTMTIRNDITFSHRNAFERWSNTINSHLGNIQETEDYRNFLGTIDVFQLGRDNAVLKSVKLLNVFPTNIAQMDLAFDNNDAEQEFTVTVSYSHWESLDTATS